MTGDQKDHWSSEAYQHSASFVPKLATKVMQWLDPQPDDVILDIGCGDGVLDLTIAEVLKHGKGSLHGIDSSESMIKSAAQATEAAGFTGCTFEVLGCNKLVDTPSLQKRQFTRVFSNAAMHWILGPPETREVFFRGVSGAIAPGGLFAFEMGGLGNVAEMRAAMLQAVARRIGLARASEVDPWFFPDEAWATDMLENKVGGWKVERVEPEWWPTTADVGGVYAWVRLMGQWFFEAIPDAGERETAIREAVSTLEVVCAKPDGGYMLSYV